MIFEVTALPSVALNLSGELDMATVGDLDSALKPLCVGGGHVTLDISRLSFMDSSGLHAIVRAAQELQDRGCVIIHGLDGSVSIRKLFELTQIEKVPNIHVIRCDVRVG